MRETSITSSAHTVASVGSGARLASVAEGSRAVCTFRAGDRLYGVDVSSLREISTNTAVTPVPPAPAVIRGLANLRSRILLILDLRPLVGLSPIECTPSSRLIIFKPAVAEDTGLLVDSGGDIVTVPLERIETVADLSAHVGGVHGDQVGGRDTNRLVTAVCKLDDELLMIVDAARLATVVAGLVRTEDVAEQR